MVFKRRNKRSTVEQIRDAVYPKKGWRRAANYVAHRVKRLPDTPHKIAIGFACGVFVSFSPIFGLHFLYAGLCAFLLRGNILASLLGTFFGNPLTFPLIAAVSLRLGQSILGMPQEAGAISLLNEGLSGLWHSMLSLVWLSEARWEAVNQFFHGLFIPYAVGGILPGLGAAVLSYFLARPLVAAYQKRRKAKLQARLVARSGAAASPAE